jgi:DNA polymerase-1
VPGIGEKTAAKLLTEHGDLESVLAAAGGMSPKRRDALVKHAEDARLSLRLARLDRPVDLGVELEDLRRKEPDWAALTEVCVRYEFHSLVPQSFEDDPEPVV